MERPKLFGVLLFVVPTAFVGCSGSDSESSDCELNKSVKDSPACVADTVGVFVSPSGDDAARGTKSAPNKTIAKAVANARTQGLPRVYVCEGTYSENVEVTSSVAIFGGLTCAWLSADVKPKLAPAEGVALRVAATGFALEDFEVVGSANPKKMGDSAIAVFVSESQRVHFQRVAISSSKAIDGAPGSTGMNWSEAATIGTTATSGGGAVVCACEDGTSSIGGKGGLMGAGGEPGSSQPSTSATSNAGLGGETCEVGRTGMNGASDAGGDGATAVGVLTSMRWTAAGNATAGKNGKPAQGGGGGGGRFGVAGGGGGGCGGCGGGGGAPGGPGGSSFALLSFNSDVRFENGSITSGDGGIGGIGGLGQPAQLGGSGGVGACDGGAGGQGAGGSGGGGGAGGHSAAVAFVGGEPQLIATPAKFGKAGGAGMGGDLGPAAADGNPGQIGKDGIPGDAKERLALPTAGGPL